MSDKNNKKPDNIEFYKNHIELELNPEIYSLDIIFSAAYIMIDRAYIVVDKNAFKTFLVKIRPKPEGSDSKPANKEVLVGLAADFNDELLNYSVYKSQLEKSAGLRDMIYKAAMDANLSQKTNQKGELKKK